MSSSPVDADSATSISPAPVSPAPPGPDLPGPQLPCPHPHLPRAGLPSPEQPGPSPAEPGLTPEQPGPPDTGPPAPRRTDGFAVAALICGILALVPFALAAGLVALARTRQGRRRGRSAAIGGLVLAVAWAAGIGAAAAILAFAPRPAPSPLPLRGTVFDLRTGQCANMARNGVTGAHPVPCSQPHEVEIYARYRLAGNVWPGAAALSARARRGCLARMADYLAPQLVGTSLTGSYVYPDQSSWAAGERNVVCEIRGASGRLAGSVRGLGQPSG